MALKQQNPDLKVMISLGGWCVAGCAVAADWWWWWWWPNWLPQQV
jgi:hypothetical protein